MKANLLYSGGSSFRTELFSKRPKRSNHERYNKTRTKLLIIADNEMTKYLKKCKILFNNELPIKLAERMNTVEGVRIINADITSYMKQSTVVASKDRYANGDPNVSEIYKVFQNLPQIRLTKKLIHKKKLVPESKTKSKTSNLTSGMVNNANYAIVEEAKTSSKGLNASNSHANDIDSIVLDRTTLNASLNKKKLAELSNSRILKQNIKRSNLREERKLAILKQLASKEEKEAAQLQENFDILKRIVSRIKDIKLQIDTPTSPANPFKSSLDSSDYVTLSMLDAVVDSCKNEHKKSFVFDQVLDSCKNENNKVGFDFSGDIFEKFGIRISYDQKLSSSKKKKQSFIIQEVENTKEDELSTVKKEEKQKNSAALISKRMSVDNIKSDTKHQKSHSNYGKNPFSSVKNLTIDIEDDDMGMSRLRLSESIRFSGEDSYSNVLEAKYSSEKKSRFKPRGSEQMSQLKISGINLIDEIYHQQKTPSAEETLGSLKMEPNFVFKYNENDNNREKIEEVNEDYSSPEKSNRKFQKEKKESNKSNFKKKAGISNKSPNLLINDEMFNYVDGVEENEISKIHLDSSADNLIEEKLSLQSQNSKPSHNDNESIPSVDDVKLEELDQPVSIKSEGRVSNISHSSNDLNFYNEPEIEKKEYTAP